jgi:hypothetical protein
MSDKNIRINPGGVNPSRQPEHNPPWKVAARRMLAEQGLGWTSTAGVQLIRDDGQYTTQARAAFRRGLLETIIGQSLESYVQDGLNPARPIPDAFVSVGFHTPLAVGRAEKLLSVYACSLNRIIGASEKIAIDAIVEYVGEIADMHFVLRLPGGKWRSKTWKDSKWKIALYTQLRFEELHPAATVNFQWIRGGDEEARATNAVHAIWYMLKSRHAESPGGLPDRYVMYP